MSSGFDIVAAKLQLDVVSLLVDAMRAVDRTAPPLGHDCELRCDRGERDRFCFEPRQVIHRDPIYERKQVIHPDPVYEHPLHVQVPAPQKVVEVVVEKSPITQPLDALEVVTVGKSAPDCPEGKDGLLPPRYPS